MATNIGVTHKRPHTLEYVQYHARTWRTNAQRRPTNEVTQWLYQYLKLISRIPKRETQGQNTTNLQF